MTGRDAAAEILGPRWIERMCCPACPSLAGREAALAPGEDAWVCVSCGARYPVAWGIPDLRTEARERDPSDTDRLARAFYERVYAEQSYGREEQGEHVEPLRAMLAGVREDGMVLELGTGLGALQNVHAAYVGTDLSIEALVRHIRRPAFAADARRLPLRCGVVDAVFTVAVLEHVPEPERALAEIARVLKPGGRAYIAPAWNCRTWAAEGLNVRPYRDLTLSQRIRKATIPVRDSLAWRGAFAIPRRALRRLGWMLGGRPTAYRYKPLDGNFEVFWASDSDAVAQLDPHETALYFESRGWEIESPAGVAGRLFHRAQPLRIRRPPEAP
ncbi:MAG TPA: class I SAM-dependent methyltransferase [Candidatus Bathyarchaeia archaeon]|nr:class I SAM-dependent methyltransferase [Candidatus Bathyarchaeia archaeon]